MQKHPEYGSEILGNYKNPLLNLSRTIALTHHEKWNGQGYPNKTKREAIPKEGRIVAISDVFDALTAKRPYKEAWSLEESMAVINEGSGEHFDPQLVEVFNEFLPEILKIKEKWSEK